MREHGKDDPYTPVEFTDPTLTSFPVTPDAGSAGKTFDVRLVALSSLSDARSKPSNEIQVTLSESASCLGILKELRILRLLRCVRESSIFILHWLPDPMFVSLLWS